MHHVQCPSQTQIVFARSSLLCCGPLSSPSRLLNRASVVAAEQTAHPEAVRAGGAADHSCRTRVRNRTIRGPGYEGESMTQPSPSIRARARWRGFPETVQSQSGPSAAVPPSWRSGSDPPRTVRAARTPRRRYATGFKRTPDGTTPPVTYRQSAISSLRASATMPIRRARFPLPKLARYHCVSALCGCHRTQFHAS